MESAMFFSPVRVNRAALNGYGYVPKAWVHSDALDRVFADAFEAHPQRNLVESDENFITLSLGYIWNVASQDINARSGEVRLEHVEVAFVRAT